MGRANTYPKLSGKEARARIEAELAAEQASEEAMNKAFDLREASRIVSALEAKEGVTGNLLIDVASVLGALRTKKLIAESKSDRIAEKERKEAEINARAEGYDLDLRDIALTPTPEQMRQADRDGAGFETFTPRLRDGTVATHTAYRRRDVPQAHKMMLTGIIDLGGVMACIWYRNLYEASGLAGNIPSTDYQKEVFSSPAQSLPFTDRHLEMQDAIRFIDSRIGKKELILLKAMILNDIPIYRAAGKIGAGWRKARKIFSNAVEQLQIVRDELGKKS